MYFTRGSHVEKQLTTVNTIIRTNIDGTLRHSSMHAKFDRAEELRPRVPHGRCGVSSKIPTSRASRWWPSPTAVFFPYMRQRLRIRALGTHPCLLAFV